SQPSSAPARRPCCRRSASQWWQLRAGRRFCGASSAPTRSPRKRIGLSRRAVYCRSPFSFSAFWAGRVAGKAAASGGWREGRGWLTGGPIDMMRTLFLQAPSFDGFDGGAGARYQMRREIQSFWYPTWLAQPAALVEGSKLVDAPPHRLKFHDVAPEAVNRDLVVLHTSTPSFSVDVRTAEALKALKPSLKIGMIGAKGAVEPAASLKASPAIDFVARNEFDFTIKDVAEGRDFGRIAGLSWRNAAGVIVHNEDRAVIENMDELPFVTPVYKRDLVIENYFSGYLKHPYISFYTWLGCNSRCTFCLWPQTIGGHPYRPRSRGQVLEELPWRAQAFPQVKEFFFDDDTLTDNLPRVEALAREIGKLGMVWSCNAKANVPRATLKVLKDNGLRLL